jgi:hypothetical protein
MKKLYFLVVLVISFATQAQIINIPDAYFKASLLLASSSNTIASVQTPVLSFPYVSSYNKIDTNNNGEIEQNEAALIKYLSLDSSYINDLTGIEYFINLESLDCSYNNLNTLDFSQNLNLKFLNCEFTSLNAINISQNQNLESLEIRSNYLTSLNLSQNLNLKRLDCRQNIMTSLDVSQNPNLVSLDCSYNNQLINLNLKNSNIIWNSNPNSSVNGASLEFYQNYLQYICADEEDVTMIQQKVNQYGYYCHVNSYCSFTPNGTFYTIQGNTKFDDNLNGCDINDFVYPNLKLLITNGTNSGSLISNSSGNFTIPVEAASHIITPFLENSTYFNISPTSFVASFPTQTSPLIQDFCVTANGVHHDVEVTFIPTNPSRPGFDANYTIIYQNKGNQVENGAITLDFNDAVLDLVSANPTFSSQATNSMIWNYTNLQPFETRTINLVLNVNSPTESPEVNNGDILNYTASITPITTDEFVSDNNSTLNQTVVGSYDPNDKRCIEGTTVGPDMIGQYVHYVIRFENTGTFAAENIVVKDMIDLAKFEVNTLVPLHSSHDFVTRIAGNKVEFIFEGINLPFDDANNDGYVAFKIKTKSNLVIGSTFSNNASIYFDYNFPIITNTYTTTVAALSTADFDFKTHFTLYPNPVREVLNFQSKDNTAINSIEIYNTLGQVVLAVPNAVSTVDVSNLQSGNYFVKVNTDFGVSNTKFVKE